VELPTSYLTRRVSRAEVEAKYDFPNCDPEFREDWERLLSKEHDCDELWEFEPPPNSMRFLGIALVRDGRVISTLIEAVD
jgi:hypothetical protein